MNGKKFNYIIDTPKIEFELILGYPLYYGLYHKNVRYSKLLAFIRVIEDKTDAHITHWSTPFEGRNFASILLKEFMILAIKKYSRIWTHVCKQNKVCLLLLHRIADRLPKEYMKNFEDQKNGLILVELRI